MAAREKHLMSSSRPRIKICGLTRYEDAALAAQSGAWGLGFIFTDKSPRCCTLKTAREIIRRLDEEKFEVEKVGVFLNESAAEINRIASETGLTFAQLRARGEAESRLPGPKGNLEIFLWLSPETAEKAGESPTAR